MPTDSWINETLYPDWGQRFRVTRELARVKSDFRISRSSKAPPMAGSWCWTALIQITEADEFVYQEMLTHVPLLAHGAAENVLIIGAGDGGVLRRVLQHKTVQARRHGRDRRRGHPPVEGIPAEDRRDAWSDKRAEVIVGDGIDYVRRAPDASFDAIIVDFTDPIGVGEVLFTDEFYRNCARILTPRGLVVNQCGVPFMQADELRETSIAAAEVLPACYGLCRCGADLCRRFHDAGLGGKGCLTGGRIRRDDPCSGAGSRRSGHHGILDARNPCRGVQSAALYSASSANRLKSVLACHQPAVFARQDIVKLSDHLRKSACGSSLLSSSWRPFC